MLPLGVSWRLDDSMFHGFLALFFAQLYEM